MGRGTSEREHEQPIKKEEIRGKTTNRKRSDTRSLA